MAYLDVKKETITGAIKFLDSTQSEGGAYYGYREPGKLSGVTAIGLLCRMYTGWEKDNPALYRGIQYLSETGPSKSDVYYNYYATQVLHHWGGEEWKKWNAVMRDQLVHTQELGSHEEGSWDPIGKGPSNMAGGRLYTTALSCMILEVYYRHMPLYADKSSEGGF